MDDVMGRVLADGPHATVGRVVESETAAVSELAPEPLLEVETVVSAEVAALGGLAADDAVEAEASLRVLLAEHDAASIEATDGQRACLADAADTLRRIVPETDLA
jgi:hypothetical protein